MLTRLADITHAGVGSNLTADLQDADNALLYLSRVLPYLAPCRLYDITIRFPNDWPQSSTTWQTLDRAISKLQQGFALNIQISIKVKKVPPWEVLPFTCIRSFGQQMLPACIAQGAMIMCNSQRCGLHDGQRS